MKKTPHHHGVALVITLAMIAMLTFLVVAFLSRSVANLQIESNSTGSVRADMLARSACEIVVSDFKSEIIAGSTAAGTATQPLVYNPKTSAASAPVISRSTSVPNPTTGATSPYASLVKQSTGRFFPATAPYDGNVQPIIQDVTNAATDAVSSNGRSVINKRWDDPTSTTAPSGPMLLISTGTPTDSRLTSGMLPHWVMMTRQGVPTTQAAAAIPTGWKNYSPENGTAAIGRFAYNIYDVSGLLDVNVAGYQESSGAAVLPVTAVGQKGTLGLAKLSVLPGMGANPENNAAQFANAWRNIAVGTAVTSPRTFTPAENYLAYLGFPTNAATSNSLTDNPFFLAGPKYGFLKGATGTTLADNRILGRQDLIRLAVKSGTPYGLSATTLPYLTHFSREMNSPSWSPTQNAGPTTPATPNMGGNNGSGSPLPYAYLNNKDNAAVPNRSFPNVRVGASWQRLTGENAVVGEPLIKYRFPLSWLALLQDNNPANTAWDLTPGAIAIIKALDIQIAANGGTPLAGAGASNDQKAAYLVRRAFGLVWDATDYKWIYTGSPSPANATPTAAASSIEVLGNSSSATAAVCTESREPNFFELLKAGILSGSLGNASDFESMSVSMGDDMNPDNHIIQIGANIIDQADSDSYPTRIAFGVRMDWSVPPTNLYNGGNLVTARSASNAPRATSETKIFAGVEDVPYINAFVCTPYRLPANEPNLNPSTDTASANQNAQRDSIDAWMQFVIWKPQQASPATPTTAAPTKFRINFPNTGLSANVHVTHWGSDGNNGSTPPTQFPVGGPLYNGRDTEPYLGFQPAAGPAAVYNVTFNDTPTDFRIPTLLGGIGTSPLHTFLASQPEGNGINPRTNGTAQLPRGMWLGETFRPEKVNVSTSPYFTAPPLNHIEFRCSEDARIELQYQDGSGAWRTYQRYDRFGLCTGSSRGGRGLFGFSDDPSGQSAEGSPVLQSPGPAYRYLDISTIAMSAIDPRSQRYGLAAIYIDASASGSPPMYPPTGTSTVDKWKYYLKQGWSPKSISALSYSMDFGPNSSNGRFTPNWNGGGRQNPWMGHSGDTVITDPTKFWADNTVPTPPAAVTVGYKDMDLVQRRSDGDSTNSVRPIQLVDPATPNTSSLGRIMNRPFRSVGELGYVFRDEPYKSLNLFTNLSADNALLDLFCVNDQLPVVAGKVNLNAQLPEVLQAVIVSASRDEAVSAPNYIGAPEALAIATKLRDNTRDPSGSVNTGPLMNPAEIANRLATILPLDTSTVNTKADTAIKMRREVVGRALAGSGQTRTWNFLVDIIAQSGRFAPSATTAAQFVVEGEKRYWLHVAIDRYTGQVIDQQLEPVME